MHRAAPKTSERSVGVAEVAFDARSGGSEAIYSYRAEPDLEAGQLVLAPLSGRTLVGVVLEVREVAAEALGFPVEKLRPLDGKIEGGLLPGAVLALAEFAAAEYLASRPATVGLAMPPGIADRVETEWHLDTSPTPFELTPAQQEALERARREGGRIRIAKSDPPSLRKTLVLLESKGQLRRRTRLALPEPIAEGPRLFRLTANEDLIDAFMREHRARRPAQTLALMRLRSSDRAVLSSGDIQALGGITGPVVKSLAAAGLLEPVEERGRIPSAAPRPNRHQLAAIEAILEAQRPYRCRGFLLFGITGSGKTEVYLRAAAEAVRAGRQVLYLVPEIAIASQVIGQLRERFGSRVAVLHSELSPRERLDNWQRIAEGSAPLILGARSALFAPFSNLGLIVMDEEHEGAYKQESTPRYHARTLVRFLAERHGCPFVLGSATPSIESYHAAREGALRLLELPSRAAQANLPEVLIEDLGEGFRRREPALLSPHLQALLSETLERGEQAILFLNRRAYSPFLICRDCGHFFTCPRCAVSLTYSRRESRLRCHHCGHQQRPPDQCPKCQGRRLNPFGVGTEKVEEAVRELLPSARVARLDRDVAQRKGVLETTLAAFGSGELDVLVGTQIVAKGLDFPRVTLVGVVAADVSLGIPDFRAAERTFQLLSQVAGRAGRGDFPGRVVIQTFNPGHEAVQCARRHDYPAFYESTIGFREAAGYPPFVRLINVVFSGASLADVLRAGTEAAARLRQDVPEATLLGPADCPLERLQNKWRRHILAKLPPSASAAPIGRALEGLATASVQVTIDVDPSSLI